MKRGFLEGTIASLLKASHRAAVAEDLSLRSGVLQRVDPRVKVAGLFGLIAVAAASRQLRAIGLFFAVALALALASRIGLLRLAAGVWAPVLLFTGTIALPAIFVTAGPAAASLGSIVVTSTGLHSAALLVARAETAATLSALLVLTTPWTWVLKALRTFRCPVVLVAILGMTYRYIFVILQTAFEMFESRKSRTVGVLDPSERRRLASSAAGVLLSKSLQLSGDVHLAMLSRGYRGEVYVMHNFRAAAADWCWLGGFGGLIAASFWWGW